MKFSAFDDLAREMYEAIPEEFRRGVTALVVHRGSKAHPLISDYYTLGECEPAPTLGEGTDVSSRIHLYHGSFREVARRDAAFDVEEELWETLLHELRHHIEDRAGSADLVDEDAAEEQNERRHAGHPFDPRFYRRGVLERPGEYWVGADCFLELPLARRDWARLAGERHPVRWDDDTFEVVVPRAVSDPAMVPVEGGWEDDEGEGGDLVVVFTLASALPIRRTRPGPAKGRP